MGSIEDADKRVLEMSAEVVCAQDLDLVEWSKESGNLSCGALRSLGCKFAGNMTEKKKKVDETKLRETMNLTQYENRVKEAVCAWGKSEWKDYEYCIRIDAGRRVSKGMIKRGRGKKAGEQTSSSMKKNKERGNGTEKLGKKKKDRNGSGVKPDSRKSSCEE